MVQGRETALSTPTAPLRRSRSRNCRSPWQQRLQPLQPLASDSPGRNQPGGDEDHLIHPMKHEKVMVGLNKRCCSFLSAPVVVDRLADVCSAVIGGDGGTDGSEACARKRPSPWEGPNAGTVDDARRLQILSFLKSPKVQFREEARLPIAVRSTSTPGCRLGAQREKEEGFPSWTRQDGGSWLSATR